MNCRLSVSPCDCERRSRVRTFDLEQLKVASPKRIAAKRKPPRQSFASQGAPLLLGASRRKTHSTFYFRQELPQRFATNDQLAFWKTRIQNFARIRERRAIEMN